MTVGLLHILGLPVEAGQHYTLQGYVRTEDLEGQTWLALSWFDAEENWLNADTRSQPISEPTLSTWTALRLDDVEPPPLAAYVQVFAQVYSGNPDSRVWFDDISIEER